jgi:membrane protease YdiL (CAAX protease family)
VASERIEELDMMNRTRISLFYLGSYLTIIGIGLLFVPRETLKILQSNGDYGDVFPRVAGMLMSGLGLSIFGMIRARSHELYPATLLMRVYFIACIVAFYRMTYDPFFLVLVVIVGLGLALTLRSCLLDRKGSKSGAREQLQ